MGNLTCVLLAIAVLGLFVPTARFLGLASLISLFVLHPLWAFALLALGVAVFYGGGGRRRR